MGMKEASDGPAYWIAANALAAAKARDLNVTSLTVNQQGRKGIGYFRDDSARLQLAAGRVPADQRGLQPELRVLHDPGASVARSLRRWTGL